MMVARRQLPGGEQLGVLLWWRDVLWRLEQLDADRQHRTVGGRRQLRRADQLPADGNIAGEGGGAFDGTLNNCTVTGNRAGKGGGACSGTLNNCALTGNLASFGGGAYVGTLINCTLVGNTADAEGGGACGDWQVYTACWLFNCIVYYNSPDNYNDFTCVFAYCCTMPLPSSGNGNISAEPLFVDLNGGNLRLQSDSPCIDAGNDVLYPAGPTDLDGLPRVVGSEVDMGAYEYRPYIVFTATPASGVCSL